MATERLSMRQIREILRQKWVLGRPHREVAQSLRIGLGTVSVVLEKAKQAGLDWPTIQVLTDEVLEARLYTRPHVALPENARLPWPDCAYIHRERRKPGVTLELLHLEYLEQHRTGPLHAVLRDLPPVAQAPRSLDAPGPSPGREAVRRLFGEEADDRRSHDRGARRGRALRRRARRVELHVRRSHAHPAGPRLDRQPRRASRSSAASPRSSCPTSSRRRHHRLSLRARPPAHLRGVRAALHHRHPARAPAESSRQTEGRSRRSDCPAMDPRPAPPRALLLAR